MSIIYSNNFPLDVPFIAKQIQTNNGKNTKCSSSLFSERGPRHPGPQMKLPQVGPGDELCAGRAQHPLPTVSPGDACQEPAARSQP